MSRMPMGMVRAFQEQRVGLAMLAHVTIFAIYAFVSSPQDPFYLPFVDLSKIALPLSAIALCLLLVAHLRDSRQIWSWRFIGIYCLLWATAQAIWSYYELILGVEVPTESIVNLLWLLSFPCLIVGLFLQIARNYGQWTHTTSLLDALVVSLGLGGLSWQYVMAPLVAQNDSPLLAAMSIFIPIGDLFIVFMMLIIAMSWSLDHVSRPQLYLVFAAFATVLTDMLSYLSFLQGPYQAGSFVDSLAMLSFALIGMAVQAKLGASPTVVGATGLDRSVDLSVAQPFRILVPYAALPMIGIVLHAFFRRIENASLEEYIGFTLFTVSVIALIVTRQVLTVRQMADLAVRLSKLNRMATRLSLCQTVAETLATGAEMVCEAMATRACVVWLRGEDKRPRVAQQHGLQKEECRLLEDVAGLPPPLLKAMETATTTIVTTPELRASNQLPIWASSLLVSPLVSQGSVLGSLTIWAYPRQHYSKLDVELGHAIAAQLGVALDNVQRLHAIRQLADRDGVTGLLNHRAVHERLRQELLRAQRFGQFLAVLMIDLDGFKLFNDTYGHPAGDRVIRQVAETLTNSLRSIDIVGRYGGDEFIVVLPETDAEGAKEVAGRLRTLIAERGFHTEHGEIVPIGSGFGVATYPDDATQIEQLVAIADANLYESKHRGGQPVTQEDVSGTLSGSWTLGVMGGLVTAVDNKDHYTRQHSEDVTSYALAIAQAIGLSERTQRSLRLAGLLHDVGKIGIPDRILRKPGPLDDEEREIVKQHAQIGEMIVRELPDVEDVVAAIGAHHERVDGYGYPRGLRGEEVPLLGRILAVADAYSAMTTNRPYRQALTAAEAQAELRRAAGSQLDLGLVEAFLSSQSEANRSAQQAS